MLGKRPRLRAVRRYPMPGYPVLGENREILYRPPEPRLSALARDLARPAIPLALASFLAQPPDATAQARPPTFHAERLAILQDARPAREEAPRSRIRRFSNREIAALISELAISADFVKGKSSSPMPQQSGLTEAQGRQLLVRFFRKNGLLFKTDTDLDGYSPEKRIGFEFLNSSGADDAKLKGRQDLDRILVVRARDFRLPKPTDVVLRLQDAAAQYLAGLQKEGLIWKSADEIVRRLRSDDEADAAKAADELKKLGPDVLADLMPFAAEKRVQDVIQAIVTTGVAPLLADLDSDDPQKRDAATNRLIELSEPVKACVEQELKKAEEEKRPEAAERCKLILQAIGD